jgi:hypothetical protein
MEEIHVKVSGPDQIDIIVVDLPGIINTGDGKEHTRQLIDKYIKDPQTLILLVSEAKQDEELTSAIELAKKHDPLAIRTLRILTKFDTFDSQDSKATAVKLVQVGEDQPLGPHAVICRRGGSVYNQEFEQKQLNDAGLSSQKHRSGIASLKGRLPLLFADLIQTNLPGLEESARKKLGDAEEELTAIGREPADETSLLRKCQIDSRTAVQCTV